MPVVTTKPIVLWTVPRSISTAFERAIMTSRRVKVFHEPFTHAYYFGTDRISRRYEEEAPDPDKSYARVIESLLKPQLGFEATFIKAMAYCAAEALDLNVLQRFTNTFLIRDPRQTIPSLYRMSIDQQATGWTYFDAQEAGFRELHQIYERASDQLGQPSPVVDAADLLADPRTVLSAYCDNVGLEFTEDMLSWESDVIPEWATWKGWHQAAHESTGFTKAAVTPKSAVGDLPDIVEATIDECMPYYLAMSENRMRSQNRESE